MIFAHCKATLTRSTPFFTHRKKTDSLLLLVLGDINEQGCHETAFTCDLLILDNDLDK